MHAPPLISLRRFVPPLIRRQTVGNGFRVTPERSQHRFPSFLTWKRPRATPTLTTGDRHGSNSLRRHAPSTWRSSTKADAGSSSLAAISASMSIATTSGFSRSASHRVGRGSHPWVVRRLRVRAQPPSTIPPATACCSSVAAIKRAIATMSGSCPSPAISNGASWRSSAALRLAEDFTPPRWIPPTIGSSSSAGTRVGTRRATSSGNSR